jgi:hypothetical protein
MARSATAPRTFAQPGVLGWVVPVAVAGACYGASLLADGWILDDGVALAQHAAHGDLLGEWTNPTYAHAGGGEGHVWRPLPATFHHIAAILFGRQPPVFRGLNLLVHLLNVLLVHRLVRSLGAGGLAAGLGALCFTLHPALADAVCWSSDLNDLLLASTLLLSAWALVALPRAAVRVPTVALLVLLACFSKESALLSVPLLALIGLWRHGWRQALVTGLAAGGSALVYLALHGLVTGQSYGAAVEQSPLWHQLAAWLTSVGWLLWVPPHAPLLHLFDPGAWPGPVAGAATVLALAALALAGWRRRPDASWSLLVSGCAWLCLLVPVGAAIPMTGLHSFRYAYAPVALAVAFATPALAGWSARLPRWIPAVALLLWCAAGARHVSTRVADWRNTERLFEAELALEPDNAYAKAQLARHRAASGRDVEASLAMWAEALESEGAASRVFDPQQERWDLAQVAFLSHHPDIALTQVQLLITRGEGRGRALPRDSYCLLADSLDALGRHQEADAAARRCPLPPSEGSTTP